MENCRKYELFIIFSCTALYFCCFYFTIPKIQRQLKFSHHFRVETWMSIQNWLAKNGKQLMTKLERLVILLFINWHNWYNNCSDQLEKLFRSIDSSHINYPLVYPNNIPLLLIGLSRLTYNLLLLLRMLPGLTRNQQQNLFRRDAQLIHVCMRACNF